MNGLVHPLRKYVRQHVTGTTTCPGCGNGIAAQAILRAIDQLELPMDDLIFVSGIGCSAWIPSPLFAADMMHTTHGRPIAFATGLKLGLPDKKVMVISGDGDLCAIGGNHLIHAARRNIDLTVVLMNNFIYVNILKHYKENSVPITKAKDLDPETLEGKIIVGEFVDREKAELTEEYARIIRQVAEED